MPLKITKEGARRQKIKNYMFAVFFGLCAVIPYMAALENRTSRVFQISMLVLAFFFALNSMYSFLEGKEYAKSEKLWKK